MYLSKTQQQRLFQSLDLAAKNSKRTKKNFPISDGFITKSKVVTVKGRNGASLVTGVKSVAMQKNALPIPSKRLPKVQQSVQQTVQQNEPCTCDQCKKARNETLSRPIQGLVSLKNVPKATQMKKNAINVSNAAKPLPWAMNTVVDTKNINDQSVKMVPFPVTTPKVPAEVVTVTKTMPKVLTVTADTELEIMTKELKSLVKDDVLGGSEWIDAFGETETVSGEYIVITNPGYYMLQSDLISSILVQSSHVVLDLNGHTLSSLPNETNNNVITIGENCDHVMVANGIIVKHANGNAKENIAIQVGSGAKNITLRDMNIRNFEFAAIVLNASTEVLSTTRTENVLIEKVKIESLTNGLHGIVVNNCVNVIVNHVYISIASMGAFQNVYGIIVKNSSRILLGPRLRIQSARGPSVFGVVIDNTNFVVMDGIRIVTAIGMEKSVYGVLVRQLSKNVLLKKIRIDALIAEKDQSAYGVFIDETSELVPSDLSHVRVTSIQTPTPVFSHHIVIDGKVNGGLPDDVMESESVPF